MNSKDNKIVIYQDENGVTKISVRFADEDLWLTQAQLAEIYDTTQQNISQHVDGIYSDGELDREATNKEFLLVREEGMRQVKRNIDHYNLDMNIALGYRVQSQVATRFRRWATERLHEYITPCFISSINILRVRQVSGSTCFTSFNTSAILLNRGKYIIVFSL